MTIGGGRAEPVAQHGHPGLLSNFERLLFELLRPRRRGADRARWPRSAPSGTLRRARNSWQPGAPRCSTASRWTMPARWRRSASSSASAGDADRSAYRHRHRRRPGRAPHRPGDAAGGAGHAPTRRNSPMRSNGRPASARRCRRAWPTCMSGEERVTVLPNDLKRGRRTSSGPVPAAPLRAADWGPHERRIRVTTLPNGLRGRHRHACRRSRPSRSASGSASARATSAPEINGVAHLLEHMAFKGTRARSAARHRRGDRGCRRPPQRLHRARADRLLRQGAEGGRAAGRSTSSPTSCSTPSSTPDELERERGVILQEIGQAERHARRHHLRPLPGRPPIPARRWAARCSARADDHRAACRATR